MQGFSVRVWMEVIVSWFPPVGIEHISRPRFNDLSLNLTKPVIEALLNPKPSA